MRDASIYDIAAQAQAGPKRPLFAEVLAADAQFRRGVDAVVRHVLDQAAAFGNSRDLERLEYKLIGTDRG